MGAQLVIMPGVLVPGNHVFALPSKTWVVGYPGTKSRGGHDALVTVAHLNTLSSPLYAARSPCPWPCAALITLRACGGFGERIDGVDVARRACSRAHQQGELVRRPASMGLRLCCRTKAPQLTPRMSQPLSSVRLSGAGLGISPAGEADHQETAFPGDSPARPLRCRAPPDRIVDDVDAVLAAERFASSASVKFSLA